MILKIKEEEEWLKESENASGLREGVGMVRFRGGETKSINVKTSILGSDIPY